MNNAPDETASASETQHPSDTQRGKGSGKACATNKLSFMCFNPKVVFALVVVAVGMWVVAPGAAAGALPVLVVAACSLSMILMMRGMSKGGAPAFGSPPVVGEASTGSGPDLADLKGKLSELQERLALEIAQRELSGSANKPPQT